MAASVQSRLLSCELRLLEALPRGDDAIQEFNQFWQDLADDMSTSAHLLDDETLALAHTVASNVEALSQGFMDLGVQINDIHNNTMSSVDATLGRYSASLKNIDSSTRSKHIPTCYKWLAANLHNPYPSTEHKQQIADDHSVPLKFVDDWFQRARRRIGWNAVCNKLFKGNRGAMLIIAHQFFVDEDPENPLTLEAQQLFAGIQMAAQNLYNNRYNVRAEIEEVTKQATRARPRAVKTARKTHLPSPPLSGPSSPSASTSNKRSADEAALSWPTIGDGSLPSPITEGDFDGLTAVDSLFPAPTPAPAPVARSKKRRLSHGDAEGRPKRPRGMPPARFGQTVSDPIPKSASTPDLLAPANDVAGNVEVPMFPPIPDMSSFAANGQQEPLDMNFPAFDASNAMPELINFDTLFNNTLPPDIMGMGPVPMSFGGMDLSRLPWDLSIPGPVPSDNSMPPAGTEVILSSTTSLRPMDNQTPLPSMVSPLPPQFMDNHPLPSMNNTNSDMPVMPDFGIDFTQFGPEFFSGLDMTVPIGDQAFFAGPAPFNMSAAPIAGPVDVSLPSQAITPTSPLNSQEDVLPSFTDSAFPDFLNMPFLPQAFEGLSPVVPSTNLMAPFKAQEPAPLQTMGDFVLSVLDEKSKTDAQSLDAIIKACQQQKALLALSAGESSVTLPEPASE